MTPLLAGVLAAGTTLDEFLAGSDHASDERLRQVGVGVSLFGVLATIGLLVFLATVHHGPRLEIQLLLRAASVAGCVTVIGALAELSGTARRFGVSIQDVLDLEPTSAAMLRLIAGGLVMFGLFDETQPAQEPGDRGRWLPGVASAFGIVGAALGAVSFAFDGHQLTEGPRAVHTAANVVHVGAGGVWFGGLVAILVVSFVRRRTGSDEPMGAMLVRFSSIATIALVVVAIVGVSMSLMIVDGFGDYVDTAWGRRLIVKVLAVAAAAVFGGYNHFRLVPRLDANPGDDDVTRRVNATLAIELLILTFVVVVTAYLVNTSPN
jgi:copper transport protein